MNYEIELILRLESGIWLEGQSVSIECRDLCSYRVLRLESGATLVKTEIIVYA